MSPEESALFEQRMAMTGIKNKSAFIRKMCIDGHIINLDLTALNEIKCLLGITANNVNQIARRVNSGGNAYREDVAEVNEQLAAIRSDFGKLLAVLFDVADAKPGKRFIRPPTIRDITDENPTKWFEEERTSNVTERISPAEGDVAERSL